MVVKLPNIFYIVVDDQLFAGGFDQGIDMGCAGVDAVGVVPGDIGGHILDLVPAPGLDAFVV